MITTASPGLLARGRSANSHGGAAKRRFQPAICGLEERRLLSTFTWDNNAGGAFNDARNWIEQNGTHGVPGAADTAIIEGTGFTVTITQPTTVGSLSSNAQIAVTSGSLTLHKPGQTSSVASLLLGANTSLSVTAGSLTLLGNSTISGPINAAKGTSVNFLGTFNHQGNYVPGVATVEPGGVLDGPGTYSVFDSETLELATNLTTEALQVAGGLVVGSGALTVTSFLEFDGGEISPAVVNVRAGGTFFIGNAGNAGSYGWTLGARTVNLAGETDWDVEDAGDLLLGSNTTINNLSSGNFIIQTDDSMVGGTFNNLGQISKTLLSPGGPIGAGTTTIVTTVNNAGSVVVDSGTLNLAGPVAQVSGVTLVGGSWTVANDTSAGAALVFSSAGEISTIGPGASVTLDGRYTSFSNIASLSANDGTFSLLGGKSFETHASLSNYGVIDLGAGDTLSVAGNYLQGSSATLDLTIAGTSSSGLVSRLSIKGDGYFGGTLNIDVPSGFKPVVNDRYIMLTYDHARTLFRSINVSPLAGGEYFTISYVAGTLYLRVY